MSTFHSDLPDSQKATSRNAQSILSFFASPSLPTDSPDISSQSPSFYRGFHKAVYHEMPLITETRADRMGFFSAFGSQLLLSALPFGILLFFMRFAAQASRAESAKMFRQMMDPPRSFLSSRSMKRGGYPTVDVTAKKKHRTTFADIVGIDEAKDEVRQYIEFLNKPEIFTKLGARLPKGCLLTGPSGTGKTLMVKAIANEANVPLYSATGADFINVYLGSGPKMIRQLFDEARENAPSIVFIDEIDAVGDRKKTGDSGGSMEDNRTINQLLKELDGLHFTSSNKTQSSSPPVIVFAATNHSSNIDPALLRAGRFDRKIVFSLPDREARLDLFRYYLSKASLEAPISWNASENKGNRPLSTDQQQFLGQLADLSAGLSAAAVSTIVNEACLTAAEDPTNTTAHVGKKHIFDSVEKILLGIQGGADQPQSNATDPANALRVIARQEAARVLIAWIFPQQQDVLRVSGGKLGNGKKMTKGYTLQKQEESNSPVTFLHLFSSICVSLAPRAGESVLGNGNDPMHITQNTQRDNQRATVNVFNQLLSYGMVPKSFGMLSNLDGAQRVNGQLETTVSSRRQAQAENIANARLTFANSVVRKLLLDRKEAVAKLEKVLLENGALGFDEIQGILGPRPASTPLSQDDMRKIYEMYSGCAP